MSIQKFLLLKLYTTMLPFALRRCKYPVYNGLYIYQHYLSSSHSGLTAHILRYCFTHGCDKTLLTQIEHFLELQQGETSASIEEKLQALTTSNSLPQGIHYCHLDLF